MNDVIEEYIEVLAEAIAAQTETDNAGDGETILLIGPNPALNLRTIAEALANQFGNR